VSDLPPGFVVDQPTANTGLPPGFVVDQPSYAGDIAKGAGIGLARGAIGLAGIPGDIQNLATRGLAALADKVGAEHPPIDEMLAANYFPSSDRIQKAIESKTGQFYQPQTLPGQYAQTIGEFAPAVIGGPESLATKLATRVAAPAIASETAGQLTQGTALEPYARIAGAVGGGIGAAKAAESRAASSAAKAATPSMADVKSGASNTYDALTSRNVAIPLPQSTLDNLANDIQTSLNNKGIRPSTAGSVHSAVDEIRSPATAGAPDVADLVAARQNIKSLLGSPDANKAGAFVALPKIEQAIEQASPGTMNAIREADKNWGAFRANEALDKKLARADLRAAGADSGMNVGNKVRQKVADLLLSNDAKYLPAETKADLEKIVRGTWTQTGLRQVGNLLGGGGGLGMLAGGAAGYEAGGLPGALAGAAVGRGARMAYNRSVLKQAEQVAQNIRARSPLGQQMAAISPGPQPTIGGAKNGLLSLLMASAAIPPYFPQQNNAPSR